MKKTKQCLALVLSAAMVLGSALTAHAAKRWELEDGIWRLYRDGELTKDKNVFEEARNGRPDSWYSLDKDGNMRSNIIFQTGKSKLTYGEGEPKHEIIAYAYPIGKLATNEWVLQDGSIDIEGTAPEVVQKREKEKGVWYYFKQVSINNNSNNEDGKPYPGTMLRNSVWEIGDNWFGFHADGTMYSADWWHDDERVDDKGNENDPYVNNDKHMKENEGEGANPNPEARYFKHDGFMVKGESEKGSPMNIEGDWYWFDDKGFAVATTKGDDEHGIPQNLGRSAPNDVTDVWLKDEDDSISISAYEKKSIKFGLTLGEVPLASPSDAERETATPSDASSSYRFRLYEHDVWVEAEQGFIGNIKVDDKDKNTATPTVTVTYTPDFVGENTITLHVDGCESDPITVKSTVPDSSTKQKDLVRNILSTGVNGGEMSEKAVAGDSVGAVESLKAVYEKADKEALKEQWLASESSLAALEGNYSFAAKAEQSVDAEAASRQLNGGEVSLVGGIMNVKDGATSAKLTVAPETTPEALGTYANTSSFDISFFIDESKQEQLDLPVVITMPVPNGIVVNDDLKLFNVHGSEEPEEVKTVKYSDGKVTFVADKFSTFVFAQNSTASGTSGGSSSGGSSSSGSSGSSSVGTTTVDSHKGHVNSVTGIVTGSGAGYSSWVAEAPAAGQTESRWKLQYADGTFAAGTYVTDAQGQIVKDAAGNPVEQPAWELINGAWYAFGVDSYAKSGMMFDPFYNGWFYIDINTGMKTGWQQINGVWYYFNPVSDGKKGIMYVDTVTPDGYHVNADGSWDGQPKAQ